MGRERRVAACGGGGGRGGLGAGGPAGAAHSGERGMPAPPRSQRRSLRLSQPGRPTARSLPRGPVPPPLPPGHLSAVGGGHDVIAAVTRHHFVHHRLPLAAVIVSICIVIRCAAVIGRGDDVWRAAVIVHDGVIGRAAVIGRLTTIGRASGGVRGASAIGRAGCGRVGSRVVQLLRNAWRRKPDGRRRRRPRSGGWRRRQRDPGGACGAGAGGADDLHGCEWNGGSALSWAPLSRALARVGRWRRRSSSATLRACNIPPTHTPPGAPAGRWRGRCSRPPRRQHSRPALRAATPRAAAACQARRSSRRRPCAAAGRRP